jgi:hypothetical protein
MTKYNSFLLKDIVKGNKKGSPNGSFCIGIQSYMLESGNLLALWEVKRSSIILEWKSLTKYKIRT